MIFSAGSGRRDSRMFGAEGASGYLRGAAGQHGGPAQDGEDVWLRCDEAGRVLWP